MTEKEKKKVKNNKRTLELRTLAVLTAACLHRNKATVSETKLQAEMSRGKFLLPRQSAAGGETHQRFSSVTFSSTPARKCADAE